MGEVLAAMEKALPPGSNQHEDRLHDETDPPTYAQLGVDKVQAYRWQKLAVIPEDKLAAILDAHEIQRAPVTTAGVLRIAALAERTGQTAEDIRNISVTADERALVECYSGEVEWYTPAHIVEAARAVLRVVDLDPASSELAQECVRATRFYTREDDGLTQPWSGTIFLNPPYASELIGRFVDKLVSHVLAGEVSAAILLTDSRSDAKWFHKVARCAQRVCLTLGRIRFMQPGGDAQSPVNGSALFYLGPEPERFEEEFGKFGLIYREPIL
jgi:DNA N-6-adenine-methyltransferase (Dam)